MGETPKTAPVVAHGGNPQDRATSLHRCLEATRFTCLDWRFCSRVTRECQT
ncbi:MAG: hypothetical protein F6J90_05385 [Moorea sp. SIOASIH]|uniref:hypothetical protein n=1 Tax=Moorena sp. SIOASIH TaxID=2607817 RepID=UPI0013BE3320|nr:hypothetical protein [Moorena sp. SIOASIH]NEO35785.1 hypothetical protein [Moorena sp. SIOASIH]